MSKREVIIIRVGGDTKKRWRKVLYEFKKNGGTAEDLLKYMLDLVEMYGFHGGLY